MGMSVGIVLIINWDRRTKLSVDEVITRVGGPGYRRKLSKHGPRRGPAS